MEDTITDSLAIELSAVEPITTLGSDSSSPISDSSPPPSQSVISLINHDGDNSNDPNVLPATNHPRQPKTRVVRTGADMPLQEHPANHPDIPPTSREPAAEPPVGEHSCSSCGDLTEGCSDSCSTCPSADGNCHTTGPCSLCGEVKCRCRAGAAQLMDRLGTFHGPRPLRCNHSANCGCPRCITGVDSATCVGAGEPDWGMRQLIPWECFAQGEYIGPARLRHVDKYRLRVDDQLQLVYRITRDRIPDAYELNIGDEIRVESVADKDLDRKVIIQPDGTVTLRLLGQVMAAGRTTDELRRDLEKRYTTFYQEPAITVTPEKVNTKLEDLRATVDSRAGNGGQTFNTVVIPDGTVQAPGVGSVPAHGLTLDEFKLELDARYSMIVKGIEVTPVLTQRAPRNIFVVGEVQQPGQFGLTGPTTVMQAIALAQGWVNGANLRNIVIFRRAEDWRLLATKVDLQGALYGLRPAPADEIWLRDSDIVVVPKKPIKVLDDAIELLFTNGIYAAAPFFSDPVVFTDQSQL